MRDRQYTITSKQTIASSNPIKDVRCEERFDDVLLRKSIKNKIPKEKG